MRVSGEIFGVGKNVTFSGGKNYEENSLQEEKGAENIASTIYLAYSTENVSKQLRVGVSKTFLF